MKTANSIIGKLAVGCVLACCHAVSVPLFAQTGQDAFAGINLTASLVQAGRISLTVEDVPAISSLSDEQLAALVTALDATPTIPASALPRGGMGMACWSLQNPSMPPLPGNTIGVDAWMLSDGSLLLNDVNFDYDSLSAISLATGPQMRRSATANDGISPPGFGDGGGDGGYTPDISTNMPPNYGTNLWIANPAVAAGYLTGIGSNTLADVQYELQSRTNLALQSDWQSEGFIFGSELTNWTPLSVAQNNRTNLFVRLKSWASSDGSGLPDWWQLQYFGTTGVDPYAFDSANDGWTIYQKFQLGVNPNAFYTPATPQGVTASLHQSSQTATVSWLPSAGSVASYVVEKSDYSRSPYYPPTIQDFSVSVAAPSFPDNLSGNNLDYGSGAYQVTYKVRAVYGGGSSGWSAEVPVQPATVSGSFVPGTNGETYLEVAGIPANAAIIQIGMWFSETIGGVGMSVSNNYNIAANDLATGRYLLPANWSPAVTTAQLPYGYYYAATLKSIDTNGNSSAATALTGDWGTPFYDGRAQLKQNLIFQLRAASTESAFGFNIPRTNYDTGIPDALAGDYQYPMNYACAGLYQFTQNRQYYGSPGIDEFLPFKENCLFRNLVFDLPDVDTNGNLTTGAGNAGWNDLFLNRPLTYLFQTNQLPGLPNLLATNASRWFLPTAFDSQLVGVDYGQTDFTLSLAGGANNWFGLPYVSAWVVYQKDDAAGNDVGLASNILSAGASVTLAYAASGIASGPIAYLQTAQPQFQTIKYCFYRPEYDWLPGSDFFTPTNDSPLKAVITSDGLHTYRSSTNDLPFLIVPAGSWSQIAGYAKLALQNGYPGVYAYLGQYFDKAYKMTNGVVTTTTTGMVSPYGNYFATEVGAAALVTLPDLDPPYQRGTCTVYSVALQVDKNHDGTMDLSFNGPDATSQASPMVFWINNDQDYSGSIWDLGHDVPTTAYYNDGSIGSISSQRDLEDYARLWVCGMPALTNGNFQVSLSWTNVSSGNPTINLFNSVETNGGIGYLTNLDIATAQIVGNRDIMFGGPGRKIATISPSQSFTFPASYFTNVGNKCFLFDGAITNGAGELMLTIADGNGNTIAQTGAWLDLHDVRDFYERAVITDNMSGAKSNWTSAVEIVQQALSSALSSDTNLIVLVHGINVRTWDCLQQGDTVFKRLYWAGFQGKFASVKWPCNLLTPIPDPFSPANFNDSELQGYKASTALTNYLGQLRARSPGYRLNILAHSQGNTVVSEAIKRGFTSVETYILTQGALPDSAYDVDAPLDTDLTSQEHGEYITPEWQPMGYHGIYTSLSGRIVNFYNPLDKVLGYWVTDQKKLKPTSYVSTGHYYYDGANSYFYPALADPYLVTDPEESRAEVSRSRTLSIGQSGPDTTHGVIKSGVNLNTQFGFNGDTFDEHSAQWTRPIQTSRPYFQQVLISCGIQPAP